MTGLTPRVDGESAPSSPIVSMRPGTIPCAQATVRRLGGKAAAGCCRTRSAVWSGRAIWSEQRSSLLSEIANRVGRDLGHRHAVADQFVHVTPGLGAAQRS